MQAALPPLPADWHAPEPPSGRLIVASGARSRLAFGAAILSAFIHIALAVAAVSFIPAWHPAEAERGGEPVLDVLVIGAEEAEALLEGAKPEAVSLTLPPVPEPEPALPQPTSEQPPEPPQPEPSPEQLPEQASEPLPEPAPHAATPPPPEKQSPPVEPQQRAKPQPVEKRQSRPHRPKTEAKGKFGEGRAAANRPAQSRGGTGGSAEVAGHAALTSFRSRLVAHLNRYKTYPEQAQERGLTGRNAVTLTLSREGRVLSAALSGPSGHALLDSATLAAVRRAQPFPAIPEGGPPSLTVTIGLNYQLQ